MKLDKLIITLQQLGYGTQTIRDEIIVTIGGREAVRGSKAKVEKLLLGKEGKKEPRISTWSLKDNPAQKPPVERLGPKTTLAKSEQRPQVQLGDQRNEPSYEELLTRLKRLEAIRKVEGWVLATTKRKKRKGRKKRKAKSNPQQRLIVSGGLPSLGKRR